MNGVIGTFHTFCPDVQRFASIIAFHGMKSRRGSISGRSLILDLLMGKVKSRRLMTYAFFVTVPNKNRSHSVPIQILTEGQTGRHKKGKETKNKKPENRRKKWPE